MKKQPFDSGFRFPVFCGIKHSGKSTCGRLTAEKLGLPFLDLDTCIETLFRKKYGKTASCREIYIENGAAFFRTLETEAAAFAAKNPHFVTAAGGGLCDNTEAWKILKKAGAFFLFLDEPEERLFARITANGLPPFLQNGDPKTLFRNLYAKRRAFYLSRCDAVLPPSPTEPSPETRTEEILPILKNHLISGDTP